MYQVPGCVPSIVVDAGSHTFKAGTAGEDLPQVLIPSYVARDLDSTPGDSIRQPDNHSSTTRTYKNTNARAGHHAVTTRKDNVDLCTPFDRDGLIEDWDLFETLLSHTLNNELRISGREHAILLADPNHNGRKLREKLTELLFEKFDVPALYLSPSSVLSAYANGRTTGVVLDVGYSGTTAVPVEDGMIVGKGKFIRTQVGGRILNDVLSAMLQERDVQLKPIWSYKRTITTNNTTNNNNNNNNNGMDDNDDDNEITTGSNIGALMGGSIRKCRVDDLSWPGTTDSFLDFSRIRLLEQVKAGLCAVNEHPNNIEEMKSLPHILGTFELPDGNTIDLGLERFQVAEETIFGTLPHAMSSAAAAAESRMSYVNRYINNQSITNLNSNSSNDDKKKVSIGLHGLVVDAIKMCEGGIHRDMYAGVCLTGGSSDMKGLFERLSIGLVEKYHKVRVLAATGCNERKYCAWTGGSILATFAEHQKNWLSRSEFDENGSSFIHRKCQ